VVQNFAKRTLQRRIVALAAAYAIALASLLGSFGAARAAAEAAAVPGGIICHTLISGQHAPSSDETNGKVCADCCCTGCLMPMAALPPPPANAVAVARSAGQAMALPAVVALAGSRQAKSHRSRAPPQTA
jgi:hypothetical protein